MGQVRVVVDNGSINSSTVVKGNLIYGRILMYDNRKVRIIVYETCYKHNNQERDYDQTMVKCTMLITCFSNSHLSILKTY